MKIRKFVASYSTSRVKNVAAENQVRAAKRAEKKRAGDEFDRIQRWREDVADSYTPAPPRSPYVPRPADLAPFYRQKRPQYVAPEMMWYYGARDREGSSDSQHSSENTFAFLQRPEYLPKPFSPWRYVPRPRASSVSQADTLPKPKKTVRFALPNVFSGRSSSVGGSPADTQASTPPPIPDYLQAEWDAYNKRSVD